MLKSTDEFDAVSSTLRLARDAGKNRYIVAAALTGLSLIVYNIIYHFHMGFSVLDLTRDWLFNPVQEHGDSWRTMLAAMKWLEDPGDGLLYEQVFFESKIKFQYPPTSLLPLSAIAALGVELTHPNLNAISRVVVLINALAVGVFAYLLLARVDFRPKPPMQVALAWSLFATVATLVYYPVMIGYWFGQIQSWLNALFALACIAWLLGRRMAAGILIGLVAVIKPQLAVMLIWALVRRHFAFAAGMFIVGSAALSVSIAMYGFWNHVDYISALRFMARHGEVYFHNQSFNGLFHRLIDGGISSNFDPHSFAPYRPAVYWSTLATSIAIMGSIFARPVGRGPHADLGDLCYAALALTVASPIAWEFHYGILPAIFVFLFAITARTHGQRKDAWLIAIGALAAVSANGLTYLALALASPINILQSYLLFAALGTMAIFWRLAYSRT